MARNAIAIILGIVVAFLVIMSIQMINYSLFPLPEGIDMENQEAMKEHIQTLPVTAFVIVLLSYLIGTFVSVFVAIKIAASHFRTIALILGTFLMIMSIINLIRIPHPIWFMIIEVLIFIPTALFAQRLAQPITL